MNGFLVDEICIIPDHLALQRRQTYDEADQGKKHEAGPLFTPDSITACAQISVHSGDQVDSCHKLGEASAIINRKSVLPG